MTKLSKKKKLYTIRKNMREALTEDMAGELLIGLTGVGALTGVDVAVLSWGLMDGGFGFVPVAVGAGVGFMSAALGLYAIKHKMKKEYKVQKI